MTIDPSRTALLVVDVLAGGADDTVYDPAVEAFADACARVTKACRDAGVQVICCDDAHRAGSDHELALWGEHGMAGTEAAAPADCLDVGPDDIVIPKRRYDAFFGTDLDITFRELGVCDVIVIGCDTNICVLQTLAGAFYRCYGTMLVSEATRTFLVGTQEGALEYCQRCFGTRVVSLDELLEALA
ncbi:MAG: cysteine hydrolase [Atopobiaceae bacterium]|nr:cysteine hydrolase [Atopobiaceae bacterium]